MKDTPVLPRLIQAIYKTVGQPLLFRLKPETAHDWAVRRMKRMGAFPTILKRIGRDLCVNDARLRVDIGPLSCPNPVGLAAGYDKAGELTHVLPHFGFGFVEIGTVTPLRQEGQKKPRLFRYPDEKALINRMGFNNPGVKAVAEALAARAMPPRPVPVGVNIGKGRDTDLEDATDDYVTGLNLLQPLADFVVANVSSPNTPHLRELQGGRYFSALLGTLAERNKRLSETRGEPVTPLFIKVSPDLAEDDIEEIGRAAVANRVGLIATNTTTANTLLPNGRRREEGGLSGAPLRMKADAVLSALYRVTKGVVPIIGVGGIFSAEDAYKKIRLGARLVQLYTGWIYEGPLVVPHINQGLLRLMDRDGFRSIQDAVGTLQG